MQKKEHNKYDQIACKAREEALSGIYIPKVLSDRFDVKVDSRGIVLADKKMNKGPDKK